jgi:hypothetical protein
MLYIVVLYVNNINKCKHVKFVRRTLIFVILVGDQLDAQVLL